MNNPSHSFNNSARDREVRGAGCVDGVALLENGVECKQP